MPPAVIADSDDDGDEAQGHPPTPSPNMATPGIDAQGQSSDRVSHTTISTDPAFFQSVFNEQIEAANLLIQGPDGEAIIQDGSAISHLPTSASVKPAARLSFSSMTSITDPVGQTHLKAPEVKSMSGWTQVTTPRTDQASLAKMSNSKDLWDVPSSPESDTKLKDYKRRSDRTSRVTTVRVTRGLRRNLERLGYQGEDEAEEDVRGGGHKSARARGSKRRRLDPVTGIQGYPDDISLINGPPQDETPSSDLGLVRHAVSAVVAPTDDDSSFLVAPKPPSASQKLEHQSMKPICSSLPARPLKLQGQIMGSSGTATNLNTPRSNLPSSHDAGITTITPDEEAIGKTGQTRPLRRRRVSSPDVIAAIHGKNDSGHTGKQRSKKGYDKDTTPDLSLLDRKGEEDQATYILPHGQGEEEDVAVHDQNAQRKKQRGRPRKTVACEDSKPINSAAPADADKGSTAKAKKRRGRPKKADQPTDAEDAPPREGVPAESGARVGETVDVAARLAEEDRVALDKARRKAVWLKEDPSDVSKPTTAPRGEEEAREDTRESGGEKDSYNSKGSSRSGVGAKPVYRVGLSKRWRIAPLLKSLRK